jgi:hypothetical protein
VLSSFCTFGGETWAVAWIRRRGWASGDVTHTLSHSLTTLGKTHSGIPPSRRVLDREMIPHSSPPPRLPLVPAATRVTIIIIGFMRRPFPRTRLAAMAMAAMRQRPPRSRRIALGLATSDPSDAETSTTIDQSSLPRSPAPIPRSQSYRHGPPSTRPMARQSKHPPGSAQL